MITDIDGLVAKVSKLFPNIKRQHLYNELTSQKKFVWIKRHVTPKEQYKINSWGIPGIAFHETQKRVYPQSNLFAHIVGYVDIDGNGLGGMERSFNHSLNDPNQNTPLQLSLDTRIQKIVHQELSQTINKFHATAGSAIIMDARNGEVIAMVSLPDFDPNHLKQSDSNAIFNRASHGLQELGSVFKPFTLAMALDSKAINFYDRYQINGPLKVGGHTINDYTSKYGNRTVPQLFAYSSNVGMSTIAINTGTKTQQEYLQRFGLTEPLDIEIYEKAAPHMPSPHNWKEINTMSISYGYGISVTPLHLASAVIPLVNGGIQYTPTLIKNGNKNKEFKRVIKESTSKDIRRLMRASITHGTSRKGNAKGYLVGAKTGTAHHAEAGGYNTQKRTSSTIAAYPINDPKYIVTFVIEQPKGIKETFGFAGGGWTAAPAVKNVIEKISPILNITPIDEHNTNIIQDLIIEEEYLVDNTKSNL